MDEDELALPMEVIDWMSGYFRFGVPIPTRIEAFDKVDYSRGEAWYTLTGRGFGFSDARWVKGVTRNPWRKCHCENYWVWYDDTSKKGVEEILACES